MRSPHFPHLAVLLLVALGAAANTHRGAPPLPAARASVQTAGDPWIEAVRGSVAKGSWISGMTASYRVPSTPPSDGQILYFFPGLQPTATRTIIQPVLAYGADGWSIRSERAHHVDDREVDERSETVPTAPGHMIRGTMRSSACNRAGVCTWTITTTDLTSARSTTLTEEDTAPYTTYFAGVLEAYGVTRCSQYPNDGSIEFDDISVYDEDGDELPVGRDDWVRGDATPWCGFGTSGAPVPPMRNSVALFFGHR
jgi:hypothetical protein